MASPRPWPAVAPCSPPACLLNRRGSSPGATPLPSSETETATCASSRTAATRIGVDSGACRAAFDKRLLSTCTMRRRSAITGGSPAGRSTRTACRPPPPRNVLRARSTRAATSEGSVVTESVPESMRPASSRSRMRPRMWPACSAMMRWNSRISAGSSSAASSSSASAEPLMAISGPRSSWLTRLRNSVRVRSISSSGARSLHGHHHRADLVALGSDRRGVDERPDAAPVGDREDHLLGAHRLAGGERLLQRNLGQRHLPPVGAPDRDHLQKLLGRVAGHPQALDDAPRFAVERDRPAGAGLEDHHADRRGFHQGLQIRPRAPCVAVRASVGDRGAGLRREQHQHVFVVAGELLAVGLVGEEEVADVGAPVAHRRALEGPRERPQGRDAERADVARQVREPQRPRQLAQVLEQPAAVGPGEEILLFLGGEAREDEVLGRTGLVDGDDNAAAGAGQPAGALDHLGEHGVEVERGADAQDGGGERGDALAQRFFGRPPPAAGLRQGSSAVQSARIAVGCGPAGCAVLLPVLVWRNDLAEGLVYENNTKFVNSNTNCLRYPRRRLAAGGRCVHGKRGTQRDGYGGRTSPDAVAETVCPNASPPRDPCGRSPEGRTG